MNWVPESPDWNSIILAIKRARNWSDKEIGDLIGCNHATIQNIRNRRFNNVRFRIGAAILNLHAKIVKDAEKQR